MLSCVPVGIIEKETKIIKVLFLLCNDFFLNLVVFFPIA